MSQEVQRQAHLAQRQQQSQQERAEAARKAAAGQASVAVAPAVMRELRSRAAAPVLVIDAHDARREVAMLSDVEALADAFDTLDRAAAEALIADVTRYLHPTGPDDEPESDDDLYAYAHPDSPLSEDARKRLIDRFNAGESDD